MAMEEFNAKKADLEKKISEAESEAEITLDNSEVFKYRNELAKLEEMKHLYDDKVEAAQDIPSNQLSRVEALGGTKDEILEKTVAVDEKIEAVKEMVEAPSKEAGLTPAEKKQENIFDKVLKSRNDEKLRLAEGYEAMLQTYGSAEEALRANPSSGDFANYALEQGKITPDAMISFIANNPEAVNKKSAVARFLKTISPDVVKEIQKSGNPETKDLLYKSIGAELTQLSNMQGPDKRNNLAVVTNFLKLDQAKLNFQDLLNVDKDQNPMAKVKTALKEWVELTKQNPRLKGTAIEQCSAEDLKLLMQIKGLGLERQDILTTLGERVKNGDSKMIDKALDLEQAGILTREELEALIA